MYIDMSIYAMETVYIYNRYLAAMMRRVIAVCMLLLLFLQSKFSALNANCNLIVAMHLNLYYSYIR